MVHWIYDEDGEVGIWLFTRLLDSGTQREAIYYIIVATEIVKKVRLRLGGWGRAKLTWNCVVSHCGRHRCEGSAPNTTGCAQPERSWADFVVTDTKPCASYSPMLFTKMLEVPHFTFVVEWTISWSLQLSHCEHENQRFLSLKMMDAYTHRLCEPLSFINNGAAECGL